MRTRGIPVIFIHTIVMALAIVSNAVGAPPAQNLKPSLVLPVTADQQRMRECWSPLFAVEGCTLDILEAAYHSSPIGSINTPCCLAFHGINSNCIINDFLPPLSHDNNPIANVKLNCYFGHTKPKRISPGQTASLRAPSSPKAAYPLTMPPITMEQQQRKDCWAPLLAVEGCAIDVVSVAYANNAFGNMSHSCCEAYLRMSNQCRVTLLPPGEYDHYPFMMLHVNCFRQGYVDRS